MYGCFPAGCASPEGGLLDLEAVAPVRRTCARSLEEGLSAFPLMVPLAVGEERSAIAGPGDRPMWPDRGTDGLKYPGVVTFSAGSAHSETGVPRLGESGCPSFQVLFVNAAVWSRGKVLVGSVFGDVSYWQGSE